MEMRVTVVNGREGGPPLSLPPPNTAPVLGEPQPEGGEGGRRERNAVLRGNQSPPSRYCTSGM